MKNNFLFGRTLLILGLLLISAGSFAQEAEEPEFDEYGERTAYDPQMHDGGEGMTCDDPSTVGEANRSQDEEACWAAYGRSVEASIRRQSEDSERFVRDFDQRMRESNNRRGGRGRRGGPRDW